MNPATFDAPPKADVLRGDWAAGYASAYDQGVPVRPAASAAWTTGRYILFHEGEQGVLVGEDGWLFSTEEFITTGETDALLTQALGYVGSVRDALDARGIALVVALVPTKAEVYPEHRKRYPLPASLEGRYDAARKGLLAMGIPTPDLKAALLTAKTGKDVFLRTDTHWTAFGASAAAKALTRSVRPILDARGSSREDYVTQRGETSVRKGDLLSFIPMGALSDRLGPRPDTIDEEVTIGATEDDQGLFDTLQIPVALVGTSYSAEGAWNFDGALRDEMEADVLKVAEQGHGPFVPMEKYLASPSIDDPRPEVVIWEIPERYLGVDVALGIRSAGQ
jgi:alginate O-acetyltransferase complex protein AlgJ